MNDEQTLCEVLKHLGYAVNQHVTLYGEVLQLRSDPISAGADIFYVEAIERKSGAPRRVRIPLNIIEMARKNRLARHKAA